MVFESMEHIYEVIQLLEQNHGYDNYLCRCKNKNYILCCILADEWKENCCPILLEIMQNSHFEGIEEVFTQGQYLIAVFKENPLQQNLDDYMEDPEQQYSFMSRLEFLYQVLCGLCIQEIPVPIACDLFLNGDVGIRADGVADGYYHLREIQRYPEFDMAVFCRILSDCLRQMFDREIMKKNYKELRAFCEELVSQPLQEYLEIVSKYTEVYHIFQKKYEDGILTQKHGIGAFLEKMKGAVGVLKKVAVVVIVLGAVLILIWSLQDTSKNKGGSYSEIGEVEIREYHEKTK